MTQLQSDATHRAVQIIVVFIAPPVVAANIRMTLFGENTGQ
jgi:hypothetical protein